MPRILIVDDEKDLQILIQQRFRKQIQSQHFEFIFAHNGFEALEIIQNSQHIDVLITDIHMPGMDGLALLSKVSAYSSHTHSIVLSAYGDIQNLRRAMNCGAYDFLTKPVNFRELEEILERSLEKQRESLPSLKEEEQDFLDLFEKELTPKALPLLSSLQMERLFPQKDKQIMLDSFAVKQGYNLILVIADEKSAVSRFSLIKIREVLRALSVTMPSRPDAWIKSLQCYQDKFIEGHFGVMGGWVDLQISQLKIACFPKNVFFFQEKNSPLKQNLQGDFPFLPGETKIFYKNTAQNLIIPLVSFGRSLSVCSKEEPSCKSF